jgi:hypothetical protein
MVGQMYVAQSGCNPEAVNDLEELACKGVVPPAAIPETSNKPDRETSIDSPQMPAWLALNNLYLVIIVS